MAAKPIVKIEGLREVTTGLKAVAGELNNGKELQRGFKEIAKHVVDVARGKMEFGPGTAARSLRPRATARGTASIAFPRGGPESRGESAGYYPWLDFGGGNPNARGVTSSTGASHARSSTGFFRRPLKKGGRYLYRAIGESKGYIGDEALNVIERVGKRQGFTVR